MLAHCWPIVYNVDPTPNQHLKVNENEKKYPKVLITAMTITWALTVNMIKLATSSVVFMQTVNMNVIFTHLKLSVAVARHNLKWVKKYFSTLVKMMITQSQYLKLAVEQT